MIGLTDALHLVSDFNDNIVVKRDGRKEILESKKIKSRIKKLCHGLDKHFIKPDDVTKKIISGLYSGVTTTEVDKLASEIAASMTTKHYDYSILAARLAISSLHKSTNSIFSEVCEQLYTCVHSSILSEEFIEIVRDNALILNNVIDYSRDFLYDYFGYKTLERGYLLKINEKVCERPQHMLMRVSLGIHKRDITSAIQTYNLMSEKWFIHASPTLFNAGTVRPQMSSCFFFNMKSDSVEEIFDALKKCACIAKRGSGIGLTVHNFNSSSENAAIGMVPILKLFNNTARYVDMGGRKRPCALAIYLEPWHTDILLFLNLKKNHGSDDLRARDLFYALWIPDLFMKRVEGNALWTLMDPTECPGLEDCWGDEFDRLYTAYESQNKGRKVVKAQEIWHSIIESQIETGVPYMLYKDCCNRKSNHQHLGTIKGSNPCAEIIQYTSAHEMAVCNVASIALNRFVDRQNKSFDFDRLRLITAVLTRNLDKIIDENFYPVDESRVSNLRHRPIGIGVQGLADVLMLLKMPFESAEAQRLNRNIFEHIYFAALEASCSLAQRFGPYDSYEGSPVSRGLLQMDMWKEHQMEQSSELDWPGLRANIHQYGLRNSLLTAIMPTASTAQILGNNESTEPYTGNIYQRRVLSGEFQIVNKHLLRDLTQLGIWSDELKNAIVANRGSVQSIRGLPQWIKDLYKTVWEIPQRVLIQMAADRGPFIDQSQSLNIHISEPNYAKLTSMHFAAWKSDLKTGMYYFRTRPAAQPIQFTVDKKKLKYIIDASNNHKPEIE